MTPLACNIEPSTQNFTNSVAPETGATGDPSLSDFLSQLEVFKPDQSVRSIKIKPIQASEDELEFECHISVVPERRPRVHHRLTPIELRSYPKPYDYPYQVANLIRRLPHSRVPSLAIDTVDIQINESSLIDEILAQRLGQVPLSYPDLDLLIDVTQCQCSYGCSKCSREIYLDVQATRWTEPVTTNQLMCEDSKLQPMPEIVLTYLPRGGRIRLTGMVRKSTGSDHVKWSPVTTVIYQSKSPETENAASDGVITSEYLFRVELVGSLSAEQILTSICQLLQETFPDSIITRD